MWTLGVQMGGTDAGTGLPPTAARGGARTGSYALGRRGHAPRASARPFFEGQLWDSYALLVEQFLPGAGAAGVKLPLHPDAPPLSPIRGVGRIMTSMANFER